MAAINIIAYIYKGFVRSYFPGFIATNVIFFIAVRFGDNQL